MSALVPVKQSIPRNREARQRGYISMRRCGSVGLLAAQDLHAVARAAYKRMSSKEGVPASVTVWVDAGEVFASPGYVEASDYVARYMPEALVGVYDRRSCPPDIRDDLEAWRADGARATRKARAA